MFAGPDYQNSILALAASLQAYFLPEEPHHETLPVLDEALERRPRNVVFLVFDGMGSSILEKHLPESDLLRRSTRTSVCSVFPPTTVAATTTLESALSPAEHSWLGWTEYFEEAGGNVVTFFNTRDDDGSPLPVRMTEKYTPYVSLLDRIAKRGEAKTAFISSIAPDKTRTVGSLCRRCRRACLEEGPHFIYGYWTDPDRSLHAFGTRARWIRWLLGSISRKVGRYLSGLDDTLVVITADHSLIDSDWLCWDDTPELKNMLVRPPSLEPRALSLFVKPEYREAFPAAFAAAYGKYYTLMTGEGFLRSGLLGPGEPHPYLKNLIGDHVALATGSVTLAWSGSKMKFKGVHAGLTEEESMVPVILL